MTELHVEPIAGIEFSAEARADHRSVRVVLVGNADVRAQAPLERFLGALHTEAVRLHADEVSLDCRELKFMNSSCLKALVSWIASVQEASATEQYKICFLSNPHLHWQKRSMHALSCFAADLVTVQQVSKLES